MRFTFLVFLVIGLSLTVIRPALVLAHEIQSDKGISVLLHVEPNDDPVAGNEATFYFAINDSANHFNAAFCHCVVSVKAGKRIIFFHTNVYQHKTSIYGVTDHFIFPSEGDYSVQLSGMPTNGHVFQPFAVSYDLGVLHENTAIHKRKLVYDGLFIVGLLIGLFLLPTVYIRMTRNR